MIAPQNMTQVQLEWMARMRATLQMLHAQWYGCDEEGREVRGGMNQTAFAEVNHKIRAAVDKLNLQVEEAFDEDGWDGECNGDLMTLNDMLTAITMHFIEKGASTNSSQSHSRQHSR